MAAGGDVFWHQGNTAASTEIIGAESSTLAVNLRRVYSSAVFYPHSALYQPSLPSPCLAVQCQGRAVSMTSGFLGVALMWLLDVAR